MKERKYERSISRSKWQEYARSKCRGDIKKLANLDLPFRGFKFLQILRGLNAKIWAQVSCLWLEKKYQLVAYHLKSLKENQLTLDVFKG